MLNNERQKVNRIDLNPEEGVRRPELNKIEGAITVSVYFPFGYVTTGRVCWPATFAPGRESDFRPRRSCGRPCEGRPLALAHPTAGFPLRQSGNTIFYLYPAAVTEALLRQAGEGGLRLVYQGAAL